MIERSGIIIISTMNQLENSITIDSTLIININNSNIGF